MKVVSEASPPGGGKSYSIELDENDMFTDNVEHDAWLALGPAERSRKMFDRADAMLVMQMLRRGDISQDYATQRIQEIRQGHPQ